jgi:hypothetical protein
VMRESWAIDSGHSVVSIAPERQVSAGADYGGVQCARLNAAATTATT